MREKESLFDDLLKYPKGYQVVPILEAALSAVDPSRAVKNAVSLEGELLQIGERRFDLSVINRIILISVGKAACPMARPLESVLGKRLSAGIVITKSGFRLRCSHPGHGSGAIVGFEAGHPIPDAKRIASSRAIERLLADTQANDLVICLISGGGSALLTAPAERISLQDLQLLTELLLRSGAKIQEINALRKHLERLKGGGLAKLIAPAAGATLLISDVVGDPLDVIASGLTVPDKSTFADCWHILEQYELNAKIPASIYSRLEQGRSGKIPETAKPGESIFESMSVQIVANNSMAAQAALVEAEKQGFQALLLTSFLEGEACQAGRMIGAIGQQIQNWQQPIERPGCIVLGGETTVTVRSHGRGGRNLELALGAVEKMAGLEEVLLVTLATDGDDGSTQAAGAFVDGASLSRGLQLGMNPKSYLAENDSFTFFERIGSLIVTGPTQTNVNDLALLFCF